jgi:fructose/tagatose bisphosphate aldolase
VQQYSSVSDLLRSSGHALNVNGALQVTDPAAFRGDVIDRLVYTAVFGDDETKLAARWIIWESAWALGIQPASIDGLYQARANNAYDGKTVAAINVRGMAYDMARAAVRAAVNKRVGMFIFELARSEMGYSQQRSGEFATVMAAAAIKEGHQGALFIQGDHYQANAKKYQADAEQEIAGIRELIGESIKAGYGNIDIDTSTLVDLTPETLDEQQRHNYTRCAELSALIREIEPPGTTISIGGEIGEVGKKNSTVEELRAYLEGFNREFGARAGDGVRGLSKVSVNTGSSHGGVVLPDGTIAKVKIDFDTLKNLGEVAREYGLGGAVQHGASTLPPELFDRFPQVGCLEIHLATGFQNIAMDAPSFPQALKDEMYDYCRQELSDERGANDTEEQFLYKTRKKVWGPFKQRVWDMDAAARADIGQRLEDEFVFLYDKFGVNDSKDLVAKHVQPVKIDLPRPASLKSS